MLKDRVVHINSAPDERPWSSVHIGLVFTHPKTQGPHLSVENGMARLFLSLLKVTGSYVGIEAEAER